jgi:hypothetical protein
MLEARTFFVEEVPQMKRYAGERELEALSTGIAQKQPICQDAYDAYQFDLRVEASQFSKFAFVTHEGRPVWARSIVVFPEDGGPARQGSFCVAFKEGTLIVDDAIAFYGKASERTYFGSLPQDYDQISLPGSDEDEAPSSGWRL